MWMNSTVPKSALSLELERLLDTLSFAVIVHALATNFVSSHGVRLVRLVANASAECLATIHECTSEAGVAGKVKMDVAGEDVSILISLLALIASAGLQLVATRSWLVAADLRPMEEMSTCPPAWTE
jgi:hypothetical protein